MSIAAITWAFALELRPATLKLIAISLADYANEDGECYPSTVALLDKTCLDRKTIIAGLDALEEQGLLRDTGKRKGQTAQVKVYQLIGFMQTKPKAPEIGTVPISDGKAPNIPTKGSRFSHERLPKTGHGTFTEPLVEPSRNLDFEKFFEIYPKKVGKQDALQAYISKITDGCLPEVIQTGAARIAEYHKLQGTQEIYILSPEKWLTGERWEDVLPALVENEAAWIPPDDPLIHALLKAGVPPLTFTTSLKGVSFFEEGTMVIALVPNKLKADWIKNNLLSQTRVAFGDYPEVRIAA